MPYEKEAGPRGRLRTFRRNGAYFGGLPGKRRHCRGPTPALGLPGTNGTAPSSTMHSSLRTTLRSALACSTTTVRSSTARTRTGSPATIASNPAATSWLSGGTTVASGTSSVVRLIRNLRRVWRGKQKSADRWVGVFDVNRTNTFGRVAGARSHQGSRVTKKRRSVDRRCSLMTRLTTRPPANDRLRRGSGVRPHAHAELHHGLRRIRTGSRPG